MKRSTAALLTGLLAVIAALMLIVFIARVSSRPGSKASFGNPVYNAGQVKPLAAHITSGGPVFNRALTSGGPDIYIQHIGTDVLTGWHAFDARTPDATRECTLEWKAAAAHFENPCNHQIFPADGTGLRAYRTTVIGNSLTIDFRNPPQ